MRKDIMISGICALSLIMLTQNAYAQTYEKESESGKVRFQCELEVPENWNGKEIPKFILESVHFVDSEKTYANFVEGKEILEHYNTPASDLYPEENYYVLADGTNVGIGMEFGVSTEKSAYYAQIGVTNTENMEKFTSATESIVNDQDAVQKVKETLENAGYAVENLVFQTSSLSADILREIENQYVAEGLLEESKRKPEWTNEDDVWSVYDRQTVSGIPVYPVLSVMAQALAYDTPESSPVVAVCSTRGIESLRVYGLYDFQEDGENVPLKGFDEIAATVETKYENLLDESTYTVTRAKFYERAYINEDQQYTAEPIWYLEINDNNSQKYVMLVNAETGKEIYLMEG